MCQYLLDILQSLYDSDVVQVNPPCSVPVLDGGAMFRDRQPLQELQQVVMVVVDDTVYRRTGGTKKKNKLKKVRNLKKYEIHGVLITREL